MKIAVGADHAGYLLKNTVRDRLAETGHIVSDFGTNTADSVDYPDYARRVCEEVTDGRADAGILFCGTGVGISIAANKVHGIRAAACSEPYSARQSREHNHSNVLCLGGWTVGPGLAMDIVSTWLGAEFSQGERHLRRIAKITTMDNRRSGQ